MLVIAHAAFVLFVAVGGLLVLRWPRLAWAHIPAAVWGAGIELSGGICPLTPLENLLRRQADRDVYAGDFVSRYLMPALYPGGLTRDAQVAIGVGVILLNAVIYALVLRRRRIARTPGSG